MTGSASVMTCPHFFRRIIKNMDKRQWIFYIFKFG